MKHTPTHGTLTRAVRTAPCWQPMSVRMVGTVAALVLGGTGKLSTAGGDPGDVRKPPGPG